MGLTAVPESEVIPRLTNLRLRLKNQFNEFFDRRLLKENMARKSGDSAWFLLDCLWRSSFRISTRYFIDHSVKPIPAVHEGLRLLVGRGQFLAVGTFFRVFVKQ